MLISLKGHWKIAYARISVDYTVYVSLPYLQSPLLTKLFWIVVKKLTKRLRGLCAYRVPLCVHIDYSNC